MYNSNVQLDLLEDAEMEDDMAVQQAWTELTEITGEQERYAEMRATTEKELEICRKHSATLEDVNIFYHCLMLIDK
jgi:hypothetical protein